MKPVPFDRTIGDRPGEQADFPTGDPVGFGDFDRGPIEYDNHVGHLEIDVGVTKRPHDEINSWQAYADANRMVLTCIINGVSLAIEPGGDPQAVSDFYDICNRVRAI